jgi:adenosylmethionine---8-amino-7-oxononanoate aminotransferase
MRDFKDNSPVWHPYTQMMTASPPILMRRGKDAYLFDKKGGRYIDAVASWWTNIHGHGHPYIARKIYEQAQQLEHVIFAGFTHEPAEKLAVELLKRVPYHQKVFYSDNGSTAVEVALKMALQFWWNKDQDKRKIIAFKDAYHGDTFGAMSISARGVFTQPYRPFLFDVEFIETPVKGKEKEAIEQLCAKINPGVAAFIYEPLVLGSSGMLMYSEQVLDEMLGICNQQQVITIADEVMTGFGRTGKFFASDYCGNKPDIQCMSKGITGGFLAFAATSCTQEIYDVFLSADKAKMFFHGHSYTANPIGCAAALASLELFETENTFERIAGIEKQHAGFIKIIKNHSHVTDARYRGTIAAIEIKTSAETGYLNQVRDKAYQFFLDRKIILRPLGNVIYILPPYCILEEDLDTVYSAIKDFLDSL